MEQEDFDYTINAIALIAKLSVIVQQYGNLPVFREDSDYDFACIDEVQVQTDVDEGQYILI